MTPEERKRMNELCRKIQVETDHKKFSQLVLDLSILLERKNNRLMPDEKYGERSSDKGT